MKAKPPIWLLEAETSQHVGCHGSSSCSQSRENAEEKFLALRTKTTLPFPEQFISLLDKTPFYIYTAKTADDILPAARLCNHGTHGPVNHAGDSRTEMTSSNATGGVGREDGNNTVKGRKKIL